MGNSTTKIDGRVRFSATTKKAACDMYITDQAITRQMVADKFGITTRSLSDWLRDGGYPLKRTLRKPLPQKVSKVLRRDMRIEESENGDLKYQIMNLNGQIEDLKESNRQHQQDVEAALSILIGSNRLQ